MAKAYYQCKQCREAFSISYSRRNGRPAGVKCCGQFARYRGDGIKGRENLRYGVPPSWDESKIESDLPCGDFDYYDQFECGNR